MQRILFILALGLLSLQAFSQEHQPFFYRFFADEGLASDKTTVVIQDHKGFLWIGTEEGLSKMNGLGNFENFKFDRNDSATLSDDHITALYEDSKNRLWVGTRDGLNLYDRASNTFMRISSVHTEGHEHGIRINDILEDDNQDLWIICSDHAVKVSGGELKEQEVVRLEGNPNLIRMAMFESRLRLGTSNGIYTLVDGAFQKSGMAAGIPVTDLLAAHNELWIGTASHGVLRYHGISGETKEYRQNQVRNGLRSNHVNDLALVDGKEVWVSTINGVTAIDIATDRTRDFYYDFENAFSLSDRVILASYQDKAGNVWLTTPNSGLNSYHAADNLFRYHGQSEEDGTNKDLMDYGILSIHSQENKIWIGSRKGISLLEGSNFKHYPFPGRQAAWVTGVYAMAQSQSGKLWLGTDYKLMSFNPARGNYEVLNFPELNGDRINTLALSEQNQLWVGTEERGVMLVDFSRANSPSITRIPALNGSSWSSVQAILPWSDGVLVGTKSGLFSVANQEVKKIPLSVFNNGVSDELSINLLSSDQAGNVLVGTKHDGLLILDASLKPLDQVGKKHGMASQDVRSVIEDENESLWLATNAGLSQVLRKEGSVRQIKNYDVADGLQSNHFAERSAAQLANGRIFMGGLSGLTFFHPSDVLDFEYSQNLNFTTLSINGEKMKVGAEGSPLKVSLAATEKLVLESDQNHFTIAFDALDYTRPMDVEYRYKMSGVNKEWVELKNNNEVTFQNLAGGFSYTLSVQSKGRFTDWSATKSLKVYVKPYYYETLWFQVLAVIGIGLLIGLFIWFRARRAAIKKKELEDLVVARSAELQEEVTIRRATEDRLKEALAEAERASEVKSQFLANMSHEIRTPLNGIMGMTELSLETQLDEEQKTMLDTIYKSSKSLKSIVNDILDIAKIEAGVLKIVHENHSVHELLDEVMASFQPQAKQKGLTLKHWVLPKVPMRVKGDAGRLRQVLVNLLANAMKFTHNGSITVIVDAMNQKGNDLELWFTVTDSGIGIPEKQQEHIFKSFVQVESGPSRAYGGTGLGLSISKELVEKMGGEIWVESKEGKGSIFSFYIEVEMPTDGELKPDKTEENPQPMGTFTGNVLIVEDIQTNQLVIAKMCQKIGLTPICVDTGREALALLKKEHFELVLMDIQMPEVDGLGITRLIKSTTIVNQQLPIVAVTASASEEIKGRCLAAGMSAFLAKPVSIQELHDTLHPLLGAQQAI